jgi:hypothetical protein
MSRLRITVVFACLGVSAVVGGQKVSRLDREPETMVLPKGVDFTVLPATIEGNRWFVRVTLNEQSLRMGVDTGAQETFLRPEVATRCGLKGSSGSDLSGDGVAGKKSARLKIERMDVGEIVVKDFEGRQTDITLGRDVDGLLGLDLFRRFVVEFDPEAKRVVFHRSVAFRAPKDAVVLPLEFVWSQQRICTEILVGEQAAKAMFDSGYPHAFVVTPRFVQRHPVESFSKKSEFAPGRGPGARDGEALRLRSVALGSLKLGNEEALLPPPEKPFGTSAFDVIIGGAIMNRYHVYYDVPAGQLLLTPLKAGEERE